MDCDALVERLPWYLNGSLDPTERNAVADHLAGCAACREELGETADVARLHATHPPTDSLLALAWGELEGDARARVEAHLRACDACRSELELAEVSAGLAAGEDPEIAAFPERAPGRSTLAARWAAAVLALAAVGVGLFVVWRGQTERWERERSHLQARLEVAEGRRRAAERTLDDVTQQSPDEKAEPTEGSRSTQKPESPRIAALERRVRELGAPRAGHPVLELVPESYSLRDGAAEVARAPIPEDAPWVTVLLGVPDLESDGPFRIELREKDRTLWRSDPTPLDELGGISLLLPVELLRPPGRSLILVPGNADPGAEPLATYRLR